MLVKGSLGLEGGGREDKGKKLLSGAEAKINKRKICVRNLTKNIYAKR